MISRKRRRAAAVALSVAVLASLALFAPEAVAQSRGRGMRAPNRSGGGLRAPSINGLNGRSGLGGSRGSGSNLFSGSSHSGLSGLEGLGQLLESARHNHHGGDYKHWDHHGYSDAEAYRDVGIANAVVDLIGILVNAGTYQAYPPVAAAPVVTVPQPAEIVPVPAPYPVTVVPAPPVILQTPSYCAPPPYVHLSPCPRPVPYRGAYPGYHSGYGHYKAQTGLRNSPGMTPPRTPAMQLPPMVSRSRITRSVQGAPMQNSDWSYRIR